MTLRGLLPLLALAAGQSWAQIDSPIEIHGVVTEAGLGVGLAGAEVAVYEFVGPEREKTVFATVVTDPRGEFRLHPVRFGDYWVEVRKQAYFASVSMDGFLSPKAPTGETGTLITVSAAHPSVEVRFALMRPGSLSGVVLDENDKPVAGVLVQITMAGSPALARAGVGTDKDGAFAANSLMPGEYLVKVSLSPAKAVKMQTFSEDALKVVDEGPQTVYWPGVPDEQAATPARVTPGASISLGTIRMRTTPSYRARVSIAGCKPEDLPYFSIVTPSDGQVAVQKDGAGLQLPFLQAPNVTCEDFLVVGLKPGSYTFLTSNKHGWAVAPVEVASKNLDVSLALSPGVDVAGRIVAADGVTLPALDKVGIVLQGAETGATNAKASSPDAKGKFVATNVMGPSHRVSVSGLGDKYYVKELRVDGQLAPGGVAKLYAGSQLEIVIDDQPATITGSVTDGDKPFSQPLIFVAKWPTLQAAAPKITGDNDGRFQVSGLEPGEYRVLSVQSAPLPDGQQISEQMLGRLWSNAEKVTVERGGSQNVELKLSDPLR